MPRGRWAQNYRDDPATAELLRRGVVIPHHEDLHSEAKSFLDPPFKTSLGKRNTERLGMHHYTVHLKVGIAKDYWNELDEKLRSREFDYLPTARPLVFNKLLDGFFTNLVGAFDNLTQELNLVYDLGLDERATFHNILAIASASKTRSEEQTNLPTDERISRMVPVLTRPDLSTNLQKVARYRKYITHRKLLSTQVSVRSTVSVTVYADLQPRIDTFSTRSPPAVASPSSGGVAPDPSGSLQREAGSGAGSTSPPQTTARAIYVLPKMEKLDILPSEATEEDLDSREIVDICGDLYRWAVDSLGRVYEVLVGDFRVLR